MKNKRIFGFALCALLFALSVSAQAQPHAKIPRVGLLITASSAPTATFVAAFRQGLRDLGYIEGKNIILEIHGGEAKPERLSALAAELVHLKVDIIVAGGTFAIRAAKQATHTIPIVMRTADDPVERGFVASLARPGGNITGVSSIATKLIGKHLELLVEAVPGVKRVAVLTATKQLKQWMAKDEYKEMETAARAFGVKLQVLAALDPNTVDQAFSAMIKERAQALVVIPSARNVQHAELILKHAAKNRFPAIYHQNSFAENGGLMSYSANIPDQFSRTAVYVDKILKGANPADLPVEQPTKFELVINLKTAKQIGLAIPPNVLARANRIIR
jgi:putative ABC transport system substrate-binding protein